MFFAPWSFLFRRKAKPPPPEYRIGQFVKIRSSPTSSRAGYFLVRARMWKKEKNETAYQWVYEGSVWKGTFSTLTFYTYVMNVPEDRLAYVLGGEYGLPEDR